MPYLDRMKISRRAEYAVRAVLDLALNDPARSGARASEIAARTGVPEQFLKAILRELREAGLIGSKRGPDGGQWLTVEPGRLTVDAVLFAIDGPLVAGAGAGAMDATPAEASLARLWQRVEGAAEEVLRSVTFEDLRREAGHRDPVDFAI
jgi:Rrf2 family protein